MVSPTDNNSRLSGSSSANSTTSEDVRLDGVGSLSPAKLNVPETEQSYNWFLPNIDGSHLTISPSDSSNTNIRSGMSINNIVSRILSHIRRD